MLIHISETPVRRGHFSNRALTTAILMCWIYVAGHVAVRAGITDLANENIFIHNSRELDTSSDNEGCETIDWSAVNNRLLIDKKGLNRYYNIYSITPEGFGMKPLTLAKGGGAAQQHSGNGAWYPDGGYFVFVSQNVGSTSYTESMPSIGWHCNLYLANEDGNRFWQLTSYPTSLSAPQGVVLPRFSPDGKRLFWSGTRGSGRPPTDMQMRALYMGDFRFEEGKPILENIQEFMPGVRHDFYEAYGFSPDGEEILFAGNLEEKQPWFGMDLYVFGRGENKPIRLTTSPGAWDRYATYSPDGKKIIWSSSNGFDIRYLGAGGSRWESYLRSELWIMDANGKNKKQLTFLNTTGAKSLAGGRSFIGDTAWSPDGRTIAAVIHRENRRRSLDSIIMMFDLGEGPPREPEPNVPQVTPPARPAGDQETKKPEVPRTAPALPKW